MLFRSTGNSFLVRTGVAQDSTNEGAETFKLVATNTGGQTNVLSAGNQGVGTINDQGQGTIFNNDGSTDTTTNKDDDRPLSINDVTVNEASRTAVFTVSSATSVSGQKVKLELLTTGTGSGYAVLNTDTNNPPDATTPANASTKALQYSNNGGTTWVDYTPGDYVTITGNSFLVRTGVAQDSTKIGRAHV